MARTPTRLAGLFLCLALMFTPAVLIAGCGKGKSEPTTPAADDETTAEADEDDPPVSGKGKKWGGWRWKGKRDDCFFVVDNKCFDDKKKACAAAKCEDGKCKMNRSAPAKVSCKK